MLFTAPGSGDLLFVSARTYPQGTKFVYGYQAVDPNTGVNTNYTLGDATGTVDTAKAEVHVSAPTKAFVDGAKAKLAKGAKLAGLTASADRIYGQGLRAQPVARRRGSAGAARRRAAAVRRRGRRQYLMGTPSCVVVGK